MLALLAAMVILFFLGCWLALAFYGFRWAWRRWRGTDKLAEAVQREHVRRDTMGL